MHNDPHFFFFNRTFERNKQKKSARFKCTTACPYTSSTIKITDNCVWMESNVYTDSSSQSKALHLQSKKDITSLLFGRCVTATDFKNKGYVHLQKSITFQCLELVLSFSIIFSFFHFSKIPFFLVKINVKIVELGLWKPWPSWDKYPHPLWVCKIVTEWCCFYREKHHKWNYKKKRKQTYIHRRLR